MENLKQQFIDKLLSTGREGVENVIKHLERSKLFASAVVAASSGHYLLCDSEFHDFPF